MKSAREAPAMKLARKTVAVKKTAGGRKG